MKLGLNIQEILSIVDGRSLTIEKNSDLIINSISTDTRKIIATDETIYCALKGHFYDGHDFISIAYNKGVRLFIVDQKIDLKNYPEAQFISVENTLNALLDLAKFHRSKINYPIIAITGDLGKTTVKEWIFHFLSDSFKISRSPKSFNSTLGVILSILELSKDAELGIIEVSPFQSVPYEIINNVVQPNLGIITYTKEERNLDQLLILLKNCKEQFILNQETTSITLNYKLEDNYDRVKMNNLSLALKVAHYFKLPDQIIQEKISSLPTLALRMETFEGVNGNLIINDTYHLDKVALIHSLEYQLIQANSKKRVVIIGIDDENIGLKDEIEKIVKSFKPDQIIFAKTMDEFDAKSIINSSVLIKGTRKANMQKIAQFFRLKTHKTYLEINLPAIKQNLSLYKSKIPSDNKLLVMVKSNAYGAGLEKMGHYFQELGIDYLGVAYVDEGVELRKSGVNLPILVMNAEEESFEDCISYQLEPAIYSFSQLDNFIKELISIGELNYPIHLKFNTGMNRLGFDTSDAHKIISTIISQPEVKIASIYSHLADADNQQSDAFTLLQITQFEKVCSLFEEHISYNFLKHLFNSEASLKFHSSQFNMIRLGIGIYGYSTNNDFNSKLIPSINWKSSISQIRTIQKGESVGYNRSFIADKNMKIGVIPVGYADGFRRSLSNGIGGVFIDTTFCPVLGKVCMDMIMVDLKNLEIKEGYPVEIIGENQPMKDFALKMETIPYEIMTNFSKRVHRVYITE